MKNSDALILLLEIGKAIELGKYKPILKERDFIINMGSIARTPQRITERQGKWLTEIYRASQGHYKKKWR